MTIIGLTEKLERLIKEKQQLAESLQKSNSELELYRENNVRLSNKIKELTPQKVSFGTQTELTMADISSMETRLEKAQKLIIKLLFKGKEQSHLADDLTIRLLTARLKIVRLEEVKRFLDSNGDELKRKVDELDDLLKSEAINRAEFLVRLRSLENTIKKAEKPIIEEPTEEVEWDDLKKQAEDVDNLVGTFMSAREFDITVLLGKLHREKERVQQLEEGKQQLQTLLEKTKDDLSLSVEEKQQKIKALEDELTEVKNQLEDSQWQIGFLERNIACLEQQKEETKREMWELEQDFIIFRDNLLEKYKGGKKGILNENEKKIYELLVRWPSFSLLSNSKDFIKLLYECDPDDCPTLGNLPRKFSSLYINYSVVCDSAKSFKEQIEDEKRKHEDEKAILKINIEKLEAEKITLNSPTTLAQFFPKVAEMRDNLISKEEEVAILKTREIENLRVLTNKMEKIEARMKEINKEDVKVRELIDTAQASLKVATNVLWNPDTISLSAAVLKQNKKELEKTLKDEEDIDGLLESCVSVLEGILDICGKYEKAQTELSKLLKEAELRKEIEDKGFLSYLNIYRRSKSLDFSDPSVMSKLTKEKLQYFLSQHRVPLENLSFHLTPDLPLLDDNNILDLKELKNLDIRQFKCSTSPLLESVSISCSFPYGNPKLVPYGKELTEFSYLNILERPRVNYISSDRMATIKLKLVKGG